MRWYTEQRARHAQWYSSMLPGMVPIALLGSAVYMALHLTQSKLAHEKFVDEANARIRALEEEVDRLQKDRHAVPSRSSWWRWA
ncbi:hypothetical protein SCLCIDRAFT_104856 [Scleroderma citrinum Foug A]|uniref:Uncharacterized protein n=1 Tax=Scleroderma citrinum Foug A TaxID=1036808 RepID=A0A0C3A4X5_9AGAM|nr:hypothetical protein SCLCIDRAFT_104856 [Scleroderma citrinum Foug A]